ncbi:hypothetical protein GUJ93_ZPchr2148g7037 [Zizania palustris]|uniref:Uncharacterized protein n=1 Tax=Zizania palustris TaxID=103762 RepID=A0A8J5VRD6_ZIZPA|nr:hypothetical protein GUJ93_ZPchr2148g7037 [Zizania palustris]
MSGGRKRDWIRRKVATAAAATGSGSPRWSRRVGAFSSAVLLQRRRHRIGLHRVDVLRLLYENVVFYLLWVIESVVVLVKLCFFFLRFGFRL